MIHLSGCIEKVFSLKCRDQRFQEKRKIVMEVERIVRHVEISLDVLVKKKEKTENYVEEFYVLSTLRRSIKM
jgi:hypothetical protein